MVGVKGLTDALRQSVGKAAPKPLRNFGGGFILGVAATLGVVLVSERADRALDDTRAALRAGWRKMFGQGEGA